MTDSIRIEGPGRTSGPIRIEGPAGALLVDDGGPGAPPLVFVHSLAGDASHWSRSLAHLRSAGTRAMALDLRGHGRSDPPSDRDFTVAGYTGDIAAVADELGLQRFVLVGHSMGAAVAAAYAARWPARVAALLLVDGPHVRQEPTPEERAWLEGLGTEAYPHLIVEFWSGILAGSRPEVRERVLADLRATRKATVVASFRALVAHEPLDDLRRYPGAKALLLSDIGDNAAAPHRYIPDLPHATLRGTGHWLQLDRPGAFHRLLDTFLAHGGLPPRDGLEP